MLYSKQILREQGDVDMQNELSVNEILVVASEAAGNEYKLIKGKTIMAESVLDTDETIALCTPYSKYHAPQGMYWADITSVQYDILNSYDTAIVIFRLQGRKMVILHWNDLKELFRTDNMRYSERAGNHWKVHIHDDGRIRVGKNSNSIPCKIVQYTDKQ